MWFKGELLDISPPSLFLVDGTIDVDEMTMGFVSTSDFLTES